MLFKKAMLSRVFVLLLTLYSAILLAYFLVSGNIFGYWWHLVTFSFNAAIVVTGIKGMIDYRYALLMAALWLTLMLSDVGIFGFDPQGVYGSQSALWKYEILPRIAMMLMAVYIIWDAIKIHRQCMRSS